ncbi:MAG TPA: DUF3553 domain-containing protein [Phycisphaerales bacterium]|nr:DUF3553 domain-containing protein [Phycisphaerales bacterium]
MMIREWKPGDKIRHAGKPEWGVGSVIEADGTLQDGNPCQRLTVRFDRAGSKTLSTAFADIRSADDFFTAPEHVSQDPMLAAHDESAIREALTRVPESATDPFASLRKRLSATLGLYRYGESPAGLLDWAASQTGMKDPLSRYSRHELEQIHHRFVANVDQHLRKLLKEIRRAEPGLIPQTLAAAGPSAKHAMRRADDGR